MYVLETLVISYLKFLIPVAVIVICAKVLALQARKTSFYKSLVSLPLSRYDIKLFRSPAVTFLL